ncbi:tensin-4 [Bifidobacterium aerophilum]|uniref:Tensin-4 n=1 Tax=Bifidobacterium aerophilum TaxID=1798155 RepID=A0A6N9Z7H6_9BIFI|nr:tensin-4 [Bifidobacterium aerophilum]NEG90592.1 tensin-4 [Bifidobacterium aerophilum]
MRNIPTLNLVVTDEKTTRRLAEITDLPVPVHVTPAGHIIVDDLAPYFETAAQAFVDTWNHMTENGTPS